MFSQHPGAYGPSSVELSRSAAERYAQVSAAYEGRAGRRPVPSIRPIFVVARRLRVSSPSGR